MSHLSGSTRRGGAGADADDRGRTAGGPGDVPRSGWRDVAVRVKDEIKKDRVPLTAAGVAFYGMLALFPALTALISVYGLIADPQQVQTQIDALTGALGGGAGDLISEQASSIAESSRAALTTGFAISLLAALWSTSSGMHGLMEALTVAYDEQEDRGFIKRRAIALALTIGGILFFAAAVAIVVAIPVALQFIGLGTFGEWLLRILRWPIMAALMVAALAVVYRYAPNRDQPRWRWVNTGAVIATVLWLLGSIAFSVYVSNFGNYNETYGALAGVIVLLLWLFLSAFVVLLGAEINAESEHQTRRDTTAGEERPMGQRGAYVADHLGRSPE